MKTKGLFKRAHGWCPGCKKEKRVDLSDVSSNQRTWEYTCKCGAVFEMKVSPEWWISYRDKHGRYCRKKTKQTSKDEAKKALSEVEAGIINGDYKKPSEECKATLADLRMLHADHVRGRWRELNDRRKNIIGRDRCAWDHFIECMGAAVRIDKIGKKEILAYRKKRTDQGAAPATINRELGVLSAALTLAVDLELIDRRPSIPRPKEDNRRERFLTKDEARELVATCPEKIRLIIEAALYTGMRRNELMQMHWSWVNREREQIFIPADATKNGKSRPVPINDDMRRVLTETEIRNPPGSPFVFTINGRRVRRSTLEDIWCKTRDAAGETFKGLRLHDLRHTFASWLVQAGRPLQEVMEILGHQSYEMVLRYAHLAPEHLKEAAKHACLFSEGQKPGKAPTDLYRTCTENVVSLETAHTSKE